jgi:hypothetical protein
MYYGLGHALFNRFFFHIPGNVQPPFHGNETSLSFGMLNDKVHHRCEELFWVERRIESLRDRIWLKAHFVKKILLMDRATGEGLMH